MTKRIASLILPFVSGITSAVIVFGGFSAGLDKMVNDEWKHGTVKVESTIQTQLATQNLPSRHCHPNIRKGDTEVIVLLESNGVVYYSGALPEKLGNDVFAGAVFGTGAGKPLLFCNPEEK